MDPTCVFNFFSFFERILYKSNCIIFIFIWCATHTRIRSKLVVIVTAGSQKITLWGPQRTLFGILRVKAGDYCDSRYLLYLLVYFYFVYFCVFLLYIIHKTLCIFCVNILRSILFSNFTCLAAILHQVQPPEIQLKKTLARVPSYGFSLHKSTLIFRSLQLLKFLYHILLHITSERKKCHWCLHLIFSLFRHV